MKNLLLYALSLYVAFALAQPAYAQRADSLLKVMEDTASKRVYQRSLSKAARAAIMSGVLPGAGQIYNKTFWQIKLPIIYTGFTVLGYLILDNHSRYKGFREAYIYRQDQNPDTQPDLFYKPFTDESLLRNRDSYRRDRDFYMILTTLLYTLTVAEAATTAHLNEFSVKDDVSWHIQPHQERVGLTQTSSLVGVSLVGKIHNKQTYVRR